MKHGGCCDRREWGRGERGRRISGKHARVHEFVHSERERENCVMKTSRMKREWRWWWWRGRRTSRGRNRTRSNESSGNNEEIEPANGAASNWTFRASGRNRGRGSRKRQGRGGKRIFKAERLILWRRTDRLMLRALRERNKTFELHDGMDQTGTQITTKMMKISSRLLLSTNGKWRRSRGNRGRRKASKRKRGSGQWWKRRKWQLAPKYNLKLFCSNKRLLPMDTAKQNRIKQLRTKQRQ